MSASPDPIKNQGLASQQEHLVRGLRRMGQLMPEWQQLTDSQVEAYLYGREVNPGRWQDNILLDAIAEGSRVLDLGCGDGDLLASLQERGIQGQGLEWEHEPLTRCLERGVAVMEANLDDGLRWFPSASFDVVVLEQTLQMLSEPTRVLREMLRVGRRCFVGFPNFGYWRHRLDLLLRGTMPMARHSRYQWFDTPEIHLLTLKDFRHWCEGEHVALVQGWAFDGMTVRPLAEGDNLLAAEVLLELEGR
jgi:methionine biosynthesis protein MetW